MPHILNTLSVNQHKTIYGNGFPEGISAWNIHCTPGYCLIGNSKYICVNDNHNFAKKTFQAVSNGKTAAWKISFRNLSYRNNQIRHNFLL
jgi:hypothetical protein